MNNQYLYLKDLTKWNAGKYNTYKRNICYGNEKNKQTIEMRLTE